MTIAQIQRFAKASISDLLVMALRDSQVQDAILELNTQAQLFDLGEDSEGIKLSAIGGSYSSVTLALHPEKSKDKITLRDTGKYYDSFKLTPESTGDFKITSNPNKNGRSLFERWGDKVEGLNEGNYQKALDIIEQKVLEIILK
ncbi:MAG: hypothetical protein COA36_16610 [Desulfotalea sp.]|nr:MAG: hypothetical protein COA36_16610 [Desulfotalea sp.]